MSLSIPTQPIQVTTLEDELQKWIDKQDDQGVDVFKMLDFDFMSIDIEFIGDKIRDTQTNQPLEENWSQLPSSPQGPLGSPPSPSQYLSFLDKGSATPLPLGNEEKVQAMQEEEPK